MFCDEDLTSQLQISDSELAGKLQHLETATYDHVQVAYWLFLRERLLKGSEKNSVDSFWCQASGR